MNIFLSLKDVVTSAIKDPKGTIKNLYSISLYRNAVYLMLSWMAGPIWGFIFWVLAARYFTASDLGLANGLTSAIGIITLLATLELHVGLIRFLPGENDRRGMINSCLSVSGVLCLVVAVVFIMGLGFWMPK